MTTPREDLLKYLRQEGFEKVHLDYVFCTSQTEGFLKRFGHSDFESYFGLSHRKIEIPVKKNFTIGHSKGSEFAFHMTRMHHPLKGADIEESN